MPAPTGTLAEEGVEEVTKGYVPWSMHSIMPCAPSNNIFFVAHESLVDEVGRVDDASTENFGNLHEAVVHLLKIVGGKTEHFQLHVFLFDGSLKALCEIFRLKKVTHAKADAAVFVAVGGLCLSL